MSTKYKIIIYYFLLKENILDNELIQLEQSECPDTLLLENENFTELEPATLPTLDTLKISKISAAPVMLSSTSGDSKPDILLFTKSINSFLKKILLILILKKTYNLQISF